MIQFDVALIGTGHWGSILKKYLEEDKGFNLKYACDSKSDLDKVFKDPDIRAIVIATPNETHADLVLRALNHNKHVFCEKPLTLDYSQAQKIKEVAKKKNRMVITDYIYTFSKGLKEAQWLVNSEKLGKLEGIELISRQLGKFNQGNVYWVLGSHMLSILDMFVPLDECTFEATGILERYNQIETGMIFFSDEKIINGNISISLNHLGKDRKVILYCSEGMIIYNPDFGVMSILYKDKRSRAERRYYDETQNLKLSLAKLYNCLIGDDTDNLDRACLVTKVLNELGV